MNRLGPACLGGLASGLLLAAATPATAAEDPLFALIERACLSTGAHPSAIAEATKALGFLPASPAQASGLLSTVGPDGKVVVNADSSRAVAWGLSSLPIGDRNYPVRVGVVFAGDNDPAAVAAAHAWGGVDPRPSAPGAPPAQIFAGPPGLHTPATDSNVVDLARSGQLQLLMGGATPAGHTMVLYGVFESP